MKPITIFHSYSGVTRGVADKVKAACGGDLIEVKPKEKYSSLSAYSLGCFRALREEGEPIDPEVIDVSAYDLLVIGTPVWAWKATPPVNAAIAALSGCEGKRAVLFATCGASARDTLPTLRKALAAKGVEVADEFVFTTKDIKEGKRIEELIAGVHAAQTS
ncbi:flavodoxin family protein [Methanosphaerula subterraneus]|uniref:flavodoxin family protein n=1 Tax=Methanosphaerula subterraneus TaxID=3350244 RepID=UPI003F873253